VLAVSSKLQSDIFDMHPGVDPVVVGRARMPSLDQGLQLQNARLGFLECLDDAYFGDGQRQHTEAPL
jgi:hypothetical protein